LTQINADKEREEARRDRINRITEVIIGCAYQLSNDLGAGFLERVYENGLLHLLRKERLIAEPQVAIHVNYDGVVLGEYVADLVVENEVLVELKACKALDDIHLAQCMNYLKATGKSVCLLLNFGTPKVEVKRIFYRL
jgi:GxxExxY protein